MMPGFSEESSEESPQEPILAVPIWYNEFMRTKRAARQKPSENPSATPPRTLENTGTCPVCQRNVKLDDRGRIVIHGYMVRYHEFVGGCFGIGHEPTEISDSGIKAYQTFLQKMQTQREEAVAAWEAGEITKVYDQRKREWVAQGDARFAHLAEAKVHELKTEIRYIASDLETLAMRLEDWRPMPLPGVTAGFAK